MYFFGSNLSPPGAAMLTHTLITNEEQKTVSVCIINTCATNASLVHDVTNTDSQTQNGCVHGHIKKKLPNVDFKQSSHKSSEQLLSVYFIPHSY